MLVSDTLLKIYSLLDALQQRRPEPGQAAVEQTRPGAVQAAVEQKSTGGTVFFRTDTSRGQHFQTRLKKILSSCPVCEIYISHT